MTPRETATALQYLAGGAGALITAAMLLQRVLRPTLETRAYARGIRVATAGMRENLEALAGLSETGERAAELRRGVERIAGAS